MVLQDVDALWRKIIFPERNIYFLYLFLSVKKSRWWNPPFSMFDITSSCWCVSYFEASFIFSRLLIFSWLEKTTIHGERGHKDNQTRGKRTNRQPNTSVACSNPRMPLPASEESAFHRIHLIFGFTLVKVKSQDTILMEKPLCKSNKIRPCPLCVQSVRVIKKLKRS